MKQNAKADVAPAECGQHTPGPWIACYDTILVESNNELVAECKSRHYGKAEDAANAVYIARAVNAHDQLVSALTDLEAIAGLMYGRQQAGCDVRPDDWLELRHCCVQARAALAQAQKEGI